MKTVSWEDWTIYSTYKFEAPLFGDRITPKPPAGV